MPEDSHLIGIDLGTTNSLVSVFEGGKPKLIPNSLGEWLTPSVVGGLESGDVVCGESARDLMLLRPDRAVATFKRWMGEKREVQLAGKTYTPPELSSLVLRSLKADAEAYLESPVTDAVITVPAYFNENQRRATQRAGELAGLRVRRILNEPTAAALAYGLQDPDRDAVLLVFDLGGGTFDVTVMEVFEGTLEILSTAGESNLGGEDFTDAILGWATGETGRALEQAEMTEPLFVARLRSEAERAKRDLGEVDATFLRIPDENGDLDSSSPQLELSAAFFEERCARLLERLRRPLERALRDARKVPGAIDEILFVGGATRMPIVRRLVTDVFDRAPRADLDPDEVVARGAAVQAALIQDDAAVEDLVMTDVCPFTLGVEISKEFGRNQADGFFLPVIHRNTTIPVSREEIVVTMHDNQPELLVTVFQGEGRRVEENLKLGELRVKGLPPAPRGLQVAIRFTYDVNGVLEVEAWVPKTGAKFSTVLVRNEELSKGDIQRAVAELQKLKFYPREDAANQRLLLFAERVLKELDPHQREVLDNGLDAFEAGLDSGDPEAYERARQALRITLSSLGFSPPGDAGQ